MAFSQMWVWWEKVLVMNLSRILQWRGGESRGIWRVSMCGLWMSQSCFSLGFLSQNSLWKLSIFRGYEGHLYLCVFGMQRVDWATWLSYEFKPRTNRMASLDFLSYSAPASMMLQLLSMLGTCATSSGLQVASYPRGPVMSPCYFAQT